MAISENPHFIELQAVSSSFISVTVLPSVVLFSPQHAAARMEVMLAIVHRAGRLPVTLVRQTTSDFAQLAWHCADGIVEQVGISHHHPDAATVWGEISGPGLLVAEFKDTFSSEESLLDMMPVGHWILDSEGSSGWTSS